MAALCKCCGKPAFDELRVHSFHSVCFFFFVQETVKGLLTRNFCSFSFHIVYFNEILGDFHFSFIRFLSILQLFIYFTNFSPYVLFSFILLLTFKPVIWLCYTTRFLIDPFLFIIFLSNVNLIRRFFWHTYFSFLSKSTIFFLVCLLQIICEQLHIDIKSNAIQLSQPYKG